MLTAEVQNGEYIYTNYRTHKRNTNTNIHPSSGDISGRVTPQFVSGALLILCPYMD